MSIGNATRKSRYVLIKSKDFQYMIIILMVYLIFVTVWSNIALFRLYHLYSAVYDLGMFAEDIWLPMHTRPSLIGAMYNIFLISIIPYLLSPLSLIGGFRIILIVQTIFIWAPVFPLYFISRKLNLSPLISFLISFSYFFYFPIAGINYFDVHNQAFFPIFFILSYMLYIYSYKKTSLFLFAMTALIKFPYDIFVALFAFYEIVSYVANRRKTNRIYSDRKMLLYHVAIFLFSTSALVIGYGISFLGKQVTSTYFHVTSTTQTNSFGDIAVTFIMLLAPVLFLPMFSRKWVWFMIPFFALMIISNNPIYYFPRVYTDQYLSMLIPFIYLGIIDVLSDRYMGEPKYNASKRKLTHIYKEKSSGHTLKTVVSILIILVLFSIVFQPWSPLSNDNGYIQWYRSNPYDNVNTYTYLREETAMIPRSNPYVLVSANIPEAYPRALVGGPYHVGSFVMGFPSPVFLNITVKDALNNTFPYIANEGHIVYVPMDYSISTITNPVAFSKSGYQSILQIMNIMLRSGKYGIMSEANGTIALERNYTYPPELYVPMNRYIGVSQGSSPTANIEIGNSLIFSNVSCGSTLWYGGTNYYPGTYNDTLHFILYPGSHGNISITAMLNGTVASEKYINIHNNLVKEGYNIYFNQVINNINLNTGYYYFIIKSNGFLGKVAFEGLNEKEVSYKW